MSTTSSLDTERRRQALTHLVEEQGSVSLSDAAGAFGVSEMTIRRDLLELEAAGLVRRVRGGAIPLPGPQRFSVRSNLQREAKTIIAQKAVSLVPRSGAVAMDASTTVGALVAALSGDAALTVVTNSWENFSAARRAGFTNAILTGGHAEASTDSFVGPVACRAAASMTYAALFTSASGVQADLGSMDVSLPEAQVKQEFARSAQRVVLLLDSSKIGERDVARSFSWDQIDLLVTELEPTDPRVASFNDVVEVK
ncbi:DeoR/GlpR family DNA-binding transcription regulator [Microbacterium sp. zg-Y818]|uniref:DeoR/GlpR family DNA-binding transcription regulator n=1 Tax=unclassified Microbacterium TaxID=2609290 RepID=UPI00214C13CE|nr:MULTISPECIES: DeoR/GlpR family DNA-binding transcription regulator [unclassified Microbacterium]MCR2800135.1 DeoR/GlpR family DNA-binding transcription regulator [Microbacterium sp. zg.Y818]WIM22106.1 DeoR/GlpR family DNA-binding transcription regulator [Microbacterium sp. zg-Y818]